MMVPMSGHQIPSLFPQALVTSPKRSRDCPPAVRTRGRPANREDFPKTLRVGLRTHCAWTWLTPSSLGLLSAGTQPHTRPVFPKSSLYGNGNPQKIAIRTSWVVALVGERPLFSVYDPDETKRNQKRHEGSEGINKTASLRMRTSLSFYKVAYVSYEFAQAVALEMPLPCPFMEGFCARGECFGRA